MADPYTSSYSSSSAGWPAVAAKAIGALLAVYLLVAVVLGVLWSFEPDLFDVRSLVSERSQANGERPVTGYATTVTTIALANTLLDKRGGYLSNDVLPPGLWLDNTPNWEFGVLVQVRDMARIMRNDLSRSQSQSKEDPALANAEGKFFFDNSSWIFPQTEDEYRTGIRLLNDYATRLADPASSDAQFYARADNLRQWLKGVETRLGSLSQRLSSSVGKQQLDTGLAGDSAATQSTDAPTEQMVRTAWLEIDDVFYEARGQAWALIHLLRAIEVDFRDVLEKKNALVSVRQIRRELEATQQAVWSPVIVNGSGFGLLANHSLVMGSYISRANAGIIDLRNLLAQG